jgi:hypothetical protein
MKITFNAHRILSDDTISTLIKAYRTSGLGLARFARQQGISPGRLHYWVYNKEQTKPPKVNQAPVPARAALPVFQEVRAETLLPGISPWAAEVSLARGLAIRFSAAASADWIGAVVQALQRPC